jgi:YD repeat-containing protein
MRSLLLSVSVIALMLPLTVNAAETVAYSYDARGRLTKVVRSGSAQNNSNVTTDYSHDKANNRKQLTTTNSPNAPATSASTSRPPLSSNQPLVTDPENRGTM